MEDELQDLEGVEEMLEDEQSTTPQTEKRVVGFKEKLVIWLKETWKDKLKCLYLAVLILQGLFALLQLLPMMELTTSIKVSATGYESVEKMFSMITFCAEEGGILVLLIGMFILFGFSLKSTIGYFVRKNEKRFGGFLMAKTSVILLLLWFLFIFSAAKDQIREYAEYGGIFRLTFFGHLYWIVAVCLIVLLFVLAFKVKRIKKEEKKRKEEEILRAKIEAELREKQKADRVEEK